MRLCKFLRILNGYTQEELAERVGVHRVTINYIERGKHGIGCRLRHRLALEYGLDDEEAMMLEDEVDDSELVERVSREYDIAKGKTYARRVG